MKYILLVLVLMCSLVHGSDDERSSVVSAGGLDFADIERRLQSIEKSLKKEISAAEERLLAMMKHRCLGIEYKLASLVQSDMQSWHYHQIHKGYIGRLIEENNVLKGRVSSLEGRLHDQEARLKALERDNSLDAQEVSTALGTLLASGVWSDKK